MRVAITDEGPPPENHPIGMLTLPGKLLSSDELLRLVLAEYDWIPQQIVTRGQITKVALPHGTFALKRTSATDQLAPRLYWLDQLARENELPILPYQPNKFGDLLVPMGGYFFYAQPWLNEQLTSKYRGDWEYRVLSALGKIHRSTQQVVSFSGTPRRWLLRVRKSWHIQLVYWVKHWKKLISKGCDSPLDQMFIDTFPLLWKYSVQSLQLLEKWKRRKLNHCTYVLCHGQLDRSHVIFGQEQCVLINFERSQLAHPAHDLVPFFRNHIDPSPHWQPEIEMGWLASYLKYFPLSHADLTLMSLFLLYPRRVWLTIEQLYQDRRDDKACPLQRQRELEAELTRFRRLCRFVSLYLDQLRITTNRERKTG